MNGMKIFNYVTVHGGQTQARVRNMSRFAAGAKTVSNSKKIKPLQKEKL